MVVPPRSQEHEDADDNVVSEDVFVVDASVHRVLHNDAVHERGAEVGRRRRQGAEGGAGGGPAGQGLGEAASKLSNCQGTLSRAGNTWAVDFCSGRLVHIYEKEKNTVVFE